MHALPESDQPWTIEEFVEKNEEICRMAAVDLHRKSTMVEEAVEEVLQLVRKATDNFKNTANSNQFEFLTNEGNMNVDFCNLTIRLNEISCRD